MQPTIGFIGLGLMGSAMVSRLQDLGYALVIKANRSRLAIDAAIARGATEVQTPIQLAEAADIIMLCVDTSASVEAIITGPEGLIEGLTANQVVIDFGTSQPTSTRKLGQLIAAQGATLLDAPLGRTPAHALEGKLNIMAAGDKACFDKVEPVLADLGENVFHLGPLGSGHTIKLMNNFLGMTTANAMAQIFAVADASGIDRQAVYDVMAAGPIRSGMMDFVAAYALQQDDSQLAFSVRNGAKDVGYFTDLLADLSLTPSIAAAVHNNMQAAIDAGMGDQHVCRLVDHYQE